MGSLNRTELIGYVGDAPEIRFLPNTGEPVAQFSLATTERWKGGDGETKEHTEWHRLVFYGKGLIENVISKYVNKGSQIFVEGRLRTRKWTDDNKIDRYSTEIICDTIQLLDRKPADASPVPAKHEEHDDIPY